MKIECNIPIIIQFVDYHEISYLLDYLQTIFGKKMKAKELGCDGMYYAIFYLSQDKEYKSLVKEWKSSHKDDLL